MARVIMNEGDTIVLGGVAQIIGTGRGREVVTLVSGDISFDASFNTGGDRVALPGASSAYTVKIRGSSAIVESETLRITIPVGSAGLELAFSDQMLLLRYDDGADRAYLGNQLLSDTPATIEGPIEPENGRPILARPLGDQVANEDVAWTYTISRTAFVDPDGDRLSYSVRLANGDPLPSWLSFDSVTRTFSGTAPQGDVGELEIVVRASDGRASATDRFTLTIEAGNEAPVLIKALNDQAGQEEQAWTFTVPAGTFTDADGDTLTYRATLSGGRALPSWLSFDATTRTFSGTPPVGVGGAFDITVRADDGEASVSDTFTLTVAAANRAPTVAFETGSSSALGAETLVNGTTFLDQQLPAVAGLSDGGYVVTWMSENQDGDGQGIYAQRYDKAGNQVGFETRVNTNVGDDQEKPDIIGLADGGYLISWQSWLQDGNGYGVYAQRFDASGTAMGAETLINTTTLLGQDQPSAAALDNGNYVVTWMSWNYGYVRGDIYAQLYDGSGRPIGGEMLVNANTQFDQNAPAVTSLTGGGYVVTWQSETVDGGYWDIFSQHYDAAGARLGGPILVNIAPVDQDAVPVVATVDAGYVVAWAGADGDGPGILIQRFDAAGNRIGIPAVANRTITDDQAEPAITGLADGGYVVAWQSWDQDGSDMGIFAQRFDQDGLRVGDEVQVNSNSRYNQTNVSVAALEDGGFIISWQSSSQDGSWWGVYSQRFSDTLSATEQVPLDLTGTIRIDDEDALGDIAVTLGIDQGVLEISALGGGAQVSGSGTDEVTIIGTLAEIQAILENDAAGDIYLVAGDPGMGASLALSVIVDDGLVETRTDLAIPLFALPEFG